MARNFSGSSPSLDAAHSAIATYGLWPVSYYDKTGTFTNATINSGGVSGARLPSSITVPSVTSALEGFVIGMCDLHGVVGVNLAALEYLLGTLTVSGNGFTDGVTMPTKTVRGASLQTGSEMAFLNVGATLTGASSPTVTITYVNQDGVGGRTASLTLPSNPAINSVFYINPHLQSGDTGIQDVTNISISGGSGGSLRVFGLLKLGVSISSSSAIHESLPPLAAPLVNYVCEPGEKIGFYCLVQTGSATLLSAMISGIPEPL